MVDIFVKKDGPRREDVAAKRMISENQSTIRQLADTLSNGEFSRNRAALAKAKETPQPEGLKIHLLGGAGSAVEPDPHLRISLNNRVVVVDMNSGKQMDFLGQLKFQGQQKYFCLATKENGFFSPVTDEIKEKLGDLDGIVIDNDEIQAKFETLLRRRLDL